MNKRLFSVLTLLSVIIATSAQQRYEYWIDQEGATKVYGDYTDVNVNVDVAQYAAGLHFFNFRAVDADNYVSVLHRQPFYLPEAATDVALDIAEYEYWFDDDTENKTVGTDCQDVYVFSIDIAGLAEGEHTFNFHAADSKGIWGPVHTETFTIEELTGLDELPTGGTRFDVYNLAGFKVRSQATKESLTDLPRGIYLINGKKVVIM